MRTQSVPVPIGSSLSSPANIAMFPPLLQITKQSPTCQLRSERRILQVATRSSSSPTKFCGSATNCTARSLIHTKSVPTDTVFAMTLGILINPLGSTSKVFSCLCLRLDPTSSLSHVSRRIGRWKLSQLSKLRLQFGTQRICKCPDRFHF